MADVITDTVRSLIGATGASFPDDNKDYGLEVKRYMKYICDAGSVCTGRQSLARRMKRCTQWVNQSVQRVTQSALMSHYSNSSVTCTTVSVKFPRVKSPSSDSGHV